MQLDELLSLGPVIPVIAIDDAQHAVPLARALVAGGVRVLEVTLRTPAGLDAIRRIAEHVPEAVVGAGTLRRPLEFAAVQAAGAQFGVSPGLTPALSDAAAASGLPWLPGVMTPSEVIAAQAAGCTHVKLFPAQQAGGVDMLRALFGPFPEVVFCPTGGISADNAAEFLSLPNVACVGGSWLTPAALLRAEDWATVERLARQAAALRRSPPAT